MMMGYNVMLYTVISWHLHLAIVLVVWFSFIILTYQACVRQNVAMKRTKPYLPRRPGEILDSFHVSFIEEPIRLGLPTLRQGA